MTGGAGVADGTLAAVKKQSRWLSEFAQNRNSQTGEDGIVAKALSLLPNPNRWCIEFGAWNGQFLSNTFDLVNRQGYSTLLIEGDAARYRELCAGYPHKARAIFLNAYVGWTPQNSLDVLIEPHAIPRDPDLVSIDVDGNDYHIWKAMNEVRPKLLLIEYNPTMANGVEFVQPADASCNQGNSPAALVKLGKEKGYELIAVTRLNLLFADVRHYARFGIADNSLEALRDDPPDHIFCGYDGTVFVQGALGARWHRTWLSSQDVQVLPRFLRKYPPSYGALERFALTWFQRLSGRRSTPGGDAPESNHRAEERRRAELVGGRAGL